MDSTHKTNKLGWYLYTIMVRDEYGAWIPAAHLLTNGEDSDILAEAMRYLKRWSKGQKGQWQPRYFLTDDSAAEQAAVRKAFPGLVEGEQEVDHLLCRWHVWQTMTKRIKDHDIIGHLRKAQTLRKTEYGCLEELEAAMALARDLIKAQKTRGDEAQLVDDADRPDLAATAVGVEDHDPKRQKTTEDKVPAGRKKKSKGLPLDEYLQREFYDTRKKWANYNREHSALLKQVTTTNANESFHKAVKRESQGGKAAMAHYSLLGCIKVVHETCCQYDARADRKEEKWFHKKLPINQRYPSLYKLPYPMQKLISKELDLAETKIQEGAEVRGVNDDMSCSCIFSRKYQLPCQHAFYHDNLYQLMTETHWERWIFMFDECGMEVYEGMEQVYVIKQIDEEIGAPIRTILRFRETQEVLRAAFYRYREQMEALYPGDDELCDRAVNAWINGCITAQTPLVRRAGGRMIEDTTSQGYKIGDLRGLLGDEYHNPESQTQGDGEVYADDVARRMLLAEDFSK